jgi:hypothetical protein
MPQRTNDFQKLVKVINRRLAPTDAKITESAMLYDNEAETDREIDILIESKLLNCDIKIGVECNAAQKPLDVRVIEAFREKNRKVNINQTIVVSKNGFTDSAKKYALKNNIKLLTFNSAKSENWSKSFEKLKNLSIYGRQYFVRQIRATMGTEALEAGFMFNNEVTVRENDAWMPVHEYAANLFVASELSKHKSKELMDNEASGSDPWIVVGFDLGGKCQFKDKNNIIGFPLTLEVVFGYKSKYRNLNANQVTYDGTDMIVGGFFDGKDGDFAHVAIKETGGRLEGTLEVGAKFPNVLGSVGAGPR